MRTRNSFDIVILGSGFGGSLLAAILSKSGQSVCLIDKGSHPRFAIGESSTPAADMILHSLATKYGLDEFLPLCQFRSWRETYPDLRCGCKRGFSYFWHGATEGYSSTENHQNELFVAASASRDVADTQWYREDVDQFFCEQAVKNGATLFNRTNVTGFQRRLNGNWQIHLECEQGSKHIDCNFIVDATGPEATLLRHLEISVTTDQLYTNSSAIYSHFDDVPSTSSWLEEQGTQPQDFPFPADDSAVHHLFPDGWLWQLRFEGGTTSVGFVSPNLADVIGGTSSPEDSWWRLQEQLPALENALGLSTLSPSPGRIFQTDRLQRLLTQAAGENWAALPFTVGFIDPLHSTGIAHTLIGVQRLAEILTKSNDETRTRELKRYSEKVTNELQFIDLLVAGCYQTLTNFECFTAWTMLYFAAATTFEQNYKSGSDDFLCATDPKFSQLVSELYGDFLFSPPRLHDPARFTERIQKAIQPFNTVGLFAPEINNMYSYTAVTK